MSKILIVDDAMFMRKFIRDLLEENNYTDILEAQDGLDAMEMYQEHKPDLVIMDITMPAQDGIETIKQLRKLDKNAHILMCSAMGQEGMVTAAIEHGAREFIVKPFKNEVFLKAVKRLLPGSD